MPLVARADAEVGKITQVAGTAQVKRGGTDLKAAAAMPVELHDQVKTFAPGEVTLQMADDSILTVNESSLLQIDESIVSGGTRTSTNIGLLGGSLRSFVTAAARGVGGSNFKVTTPNAIAGVRGTDFLCTYHEGNARPGFANCFQFTDCATTTGTVVVSNNPPRPGTEVKVGPGQMTTVACLAAPLAAFAGTIGVLTGTLATGAGHAALLGPAAIVGVGAGSAAVIGGTTAAVIESTGGGGGTSSPTR
ncbi:MAG: FecR domain-containing protein [Candidatus Binataceae bacterium]